MTPTELQQRRAELGLSLDQVVTRMVRVLPDRFVPTKQVIHRLEKGSTPIESVNVITLLALADVLDVPLSVLAPQIFDDLPAVRDLVLRSRCSLDVQGRLFRVA